MTVFVNALADVVEIHSRTRESFKSKVNPLGIRMVRTGGAEGETKRKRTPSLWQCRENQRERHEKRERKREGERAGCPFVVDLLRCRRGFSFLCVRVSLFRYFASQLPVPENSKASNSSLPLLLFTYATLQNCTPHKWVGRWIQMSIGSSITINHVYFSSSLVKKRRTCKDLNASRTICCAICTNNGEWNRILANRIREWIEL